jgi:hypothetical protein
MRLLRAGQRGAPPLNCGVIRRGKRIVRQVNDTTSGRHAMRHVGRFLLLVGLGAVLGLLTLFLVSPRHDAPVGAPIAINRPPTATPGSAAATRSRPIASPSADVPSSRDAGEAGQPDSERETIAESAAVSTDSAVAGAPNARLDQIPAPLRQWFAERDDIASYPPHWCFRLSGATPEAGAAARLHVALDSRVVAQGSRSARVDTRASLPPDVTAVLWQAVDAQSYRGSRLQLVAQVRSEAAVARLFLRSQSGPGRDMERLRSDLAGEPGVGQPIASDTDWTRVAVVHDVPFDAFNVYYGVALYGNAKLWLDDVRITVVDTRVPLTQEDSADDSPSIRIGPPMWAWNGPSNLDFELTSAAVGCVVNRRDPAPDPP